jgi:hypothetical protein
MAGNLDAGSQQALVVEVNKQFTGQEQQEDAGAKVDVRHHPFDWWDLLVFMMPVATIVFAMWFEAEL